MRCMKSAILLSEENTDNIFLELKVTKPVEKTPNSYLHTPYINVNINAFRLREKSG
jgi:hypothetical protein